MLNDNDKGKSEVPLCPISRKVKYLRYLRYARLSRLLTMSEKKVSCYLTESIKVRYSVDIIVE